MDLFEQANLLADEDKPFWTNNAFSYNLIQANKPISEDGYALRLTYPSRQDADPCNIALMPYKNELLGAYLVRELASERGIAFKSHEANWAFLAHIFLEQTVCYLEAPTAKFKMKTVATRSLEIANNLSAKPIQDFAFFLKILHGDTEYFKSMIDTHVEFKEMGTKILNIIAELIDTDYKPSKHTIEWLATTFATDTKKIKVYLEAQALLSDGYDACHEGKCGYIKLKPAENGHYEMPARIQGTKYSLSTSTIFVPLTFMRAQAKRIIAQLKEGIVLARFKRDNDIVRDLLASSSFTVTSLVFRDTDCENVEPPCEYIEDRGYIRTVDICSSALGGDTSRAISLARISGVLFIQPDLISRENLSAQLTQYGFHPSIASADLDAVATRFKTYIDKLSPQLPLLQMLYKELTRDEKGINFQSSAQAIIAINGYVDFQVTLTSSFVRSLHLFMLANPLFFPGYTGKPEDLSNVSITTTPHIRTLGTV